MYLLLAFPTSLRVFHQTISDPFGKLVRHEELLDDWYTKILNVILKLNKAGWCLQTIALFFKLHLFRWSPFFESASLKQTEKKHKPKNSFACINSSAYSSSSVCKTVSGSSCTGPKKLDLSSKLHRLLIITLEKEEAHLNVCTKGHCYSWHD